MKLICISLLLSFFSLLCFAQTSDPTLDTTGLPAYLRLLPPPSPEPWRKITGKQRFENFASFTLSPGAGLASVTSAAFGQALNSPKEWGQGWRPYGKRVASSYGGTAVAYTITYATSALFKEDNRYFRSNKNGFTARLGHAIISPYVAHNNSGGTHFSASSFLGSAAGSAIPLLWSPPSWQGWNRVAVSYSLWYGGLAGVNLVREFLPGLIHKARLKHDSKTMPSSSPKK